MPAKQTDEKSGKAASAMGEVIEMLNQIENILNKLVEAQTTTSAHIIDLLVKIDGRTAAKQSSRKKEVTPQQTATATFPSNSMYFFKKLWGDPKTAADTKARYCDDRMTEALKKHMSKDENKDKVDTAKIEAEYSFIWKSYIKDNKDLKTKIQTEFEKAREEFNKTKRTPVKTDDNANANTE